MGNRERVRDNSFSPSIVPVATLSALTLPDSKHIGAAYGTYTLSRRLTVLHSYGLGVLHFPFGATFHTVCISLAFLLVMNDKLFVLTMSIV